MVQTKTIREGLVAVTYDGTQIALRPSGKENIGRNERILVEIKDNQLIIDKEVADMHGIRICVGDNRNI